MKKSHIKIFSTLIPLTIRKKIWRATPKFYKLNTYRLDNPTIISNLLRIDEKFLIRFINNEDEAELKIFYSNNNVYEKIVVYRLIFDEWKGLAVFDKNTMRIAYMAWIIDKSIEYFEEFGVTLSQGQFLLKDGQCKEEYRHQGLHTRMEQERINYCVMNNAKEVFIQIHDSNKKGIESVLNNGYNPYKQNYVISWPIFNVFRPLGAFLKNPLKKVVK